MLVNEKSTAKVYVVPVSLEKHPNADKLSLVRIDDYTCIVNTEEFANIKVAAYIPPDSIIDMSCTDFATYPLKNGRVRAKKIRGLVSYGLLHPLSDNYTIGQDVTEELNVKHYDPEEKITKRPKYFIETTKGPSYPKYDVDSFMKYGRKVFQDGEEVIITEKLHGCNSRYIFKDGEQFCGSRNEWKTRYGRLTVSYEEFLEKFEDKERAKKIYDNAINKLNLWWDVYERYPQISAFCKEYPGYCLYGEVYGMNPGYEYDGKNKFRAFDILAPDGKWLDYEDFIEMTWKFNIPSVPLVGIYKYNTEEMIKLAEGNTLIGKGIREGVVIKPIKERWDEKLGRVCLKIINPEYLEKN